MSGSSADVIGREIAETVAELANARSMLAFAEDEFIFGQCMYIESLKSRLNALFARAKLEYTEGAESGDCIY